MTLARICSNFSCAGATNSSSQEELHEKGSEDTGSSRTYLGTPQLSIPAKPTDGFPAVQRNFLLAYPQYISPVLDSTRQTEFKRLQKLVYLDYTGASLYPESLVKQSNEYLCSNVLGNPHSSNPPSRLASYHTNAARTALLQFLGADPNIYCVVWTANASSAMRIVGEGYPWHPGSRLFLGHDSHSLSQGDTSITFFELTLTKDSMNGLRVFAHSSGASVDYYPISTSGGWEERWSLLQKVSHLRPPPIDTYPGIFGLTGQSNVTGFKAPLYLLQHASSQGFHTLLDAAALAPTTRISLSGPQLNNSVDALTISVYKIIGYPTGLGALVIKKNFLDQLKKPWFAGGTVDVAQVPGTAFTLFDGHERFEDGTINFLSMIPIPRGLSMMSTLIPVLSQRLSCLTHWTIHALSEIKHQKSGRPLVHVRSPSPSLSLSAVSQTQGALVAFEVSDAAGTFVNCEAIEYGAGKAGICLRAGCMCNPGGTSGIAGMTFMMDEVVSGDRKEDLEARFGVRSRGVVRASFGLASNFADAWTFVKYMRTLAFPNELSQLLDEWAEYTISGH